MTTQAQQVQQEFGSDAVLPTGSSDVSLRSKRQELDTRTASLTVSPDVGTLSLSEYFPSTADAELVVVVWPGMGVTAAHYEPLAVELASRGVAVIVVDLPGQGLSRRSVRWNAGVGYHGLAAVAAPAVTEWARGEAGGAADIFHLGHSMGGHIALLHAARHPATIRGVVLVASGTPYYRAFTGRRAVGYALGGALMRALTPVLGYWPGGLLRFGGTQSAPLIREFGRTVMTGRFAPRDADIDYEKALRDLTIPVLAIDVTGDHIAPPTAVDALCAKAATASVERTNFSPHRPLDHYRWVRRAEDLAPQIVEWLQRNHLPERSRSAPHDQELHH